jgi:hypothetical protein
MLKLKQLGNNKTELTIGTITGRIIISLVMKHQLQDGIMREHLEQRKSIRQPQLNMLMNT